MKEQREELEELKTKLETVNEKVVEKQSILEEV